MARDPIPTSETMGPMSGYPNRVGTGTKGIVAVVPDIMVPVPHLSTAMHIVAKRAHLTPTTGEQNRVTKSRIKDCLSAKEVVA
jgi:hypothetical protein